VTYLVAAYVFAVVVLAGYLAWVLRSTAIVSRELRRLPPPRT
jgi:heme exporter protein CcmD